MKILHNVWYLILALTIMIGMTAVFESVYQRGYRQGYFSAACKESGGKVFHGECLSKDSVVIRIDAGN